MDAFFDLFGPLANTKPKRVALMIALAYITYQIIQYSASCDDNNKVNKPEEKEEKDTIIIEKTNEIKSISVSEEMLTITNCGYKPINGNYRWFLHVKKWLFFTDKNDEHFTLESNIGVNRVYDILKSKNILFEWDKSINMCWIISDIDNEIIYYAAPQINNEYIPNDYQWMTINGIKPMPQIFVNLVDKTDEPDPYEMFGNVIPNDNEIKSVFRQLDIHNNGVINRDKIMEGFKILGYIIDNVTILSILPNEDDMFDENKFMFEFKKHASAMDQNIQQQITFDVNEDIDDDDDDDNEILEKKENLEDDINGDNGVIVHEEVDNDNNNNNDDDVDDDDDDSLSELDA